MNLSDLSLNMKTTAEAKKKENGFQFKQKRTKLASILSTGTGPGNYAFRAKTSRGTPFTGNITLLTPYTCLCVQYIYIHTHTPTTHSHPEFLTGGSRSLLRDVRRNENDAM